MKLQVDVADLSQCRKDLTVEVPVEEVKAAFEKTYGVYARHVKSPGFRPGRVPREIIRQRFAKEVRDEVINSLVPEALHDAIVEHKLRVVGDPQIDDLSINEGEPMKFRATLEVLPEFELKEYKGLKLTKKVAPVTDEEIEHTLDHLRQSVAEFVPVEDRESRDGDFVSVNLVGKYVEPQEEEDLKSDDVQIEIGADNVQPEFNENLRGVNAGDVREFRVEYPEDFSAEGLAGKTIDFTATVVAVREKEAPELDDEFARDFGDYENLQQLRDKIRENLTASAEARAAADLREQAVKRIIEDYDFEAPSALVEPQAAERAREFAYVLMRNGVPPQTIKEIDWEERMNEFRPLAARDIRMALVFAKIAEAEKVELSGWEVDAEIERMAAASGEPPIQLKARLTKDDSLSSIENRLRHQRALEAVIKHAEITVEDFNEDQSEHQAQSPGQTETEGEVRNEGKSQAL
ncbi:MAG TPA: trigger factor [Blastocatellia bacterium]|nr:trigger factor [Blastocatellia bacterium]